MNVMAALVLFAVMQTGPTTQDTIRGEYIIPIPRIEQPAVPVEVSVVVEHQPMDTAFIRELHEAGAASAEAAMAAYLQTCGCVDRAGPPPLFWYGLLALGAYAVRKASNEGVTINVNSNAQASAEGSGGSGGDGGAGGDGGDGGGGSTPPPDDCRPYGG